ncbi:DUF972 family protein [Tuanshanicoccus lijuaniae]|uniref:initiation control protein YabA n=1 Tax=Aerococcaceae bacterium zg-1292 TaxID=2774330 RepID=UPI0019353464|nr:DUF972 family protein [Aerococcaceae bacterium zg-1292]MBF6625349.1 DUF972 family protein [Aerococcaceae bacterium zg-BR9]MBF6979009.1 DUF972 family protein [Aerococcaceae bacterium zg-BR22]MBS4456130.1 DUF972 family protein [Aerococcaceae bacterium zg-A91]MBS4457981.1 DUF972 family protein [Aerococcaceae bacterium zg-BR33]
MEQQSVQRLIQTIQEQSLHYQDTVQQLTQAVLSLSEENNRLRMLNHELEDQLQQYVIEHLPEAHPIVQEQQPSHKKTTSGKERLQGFYDDGIHVCHELFGQRRQSDEECLFCQGIILGLDQV